MEKHYELMNLLLAHNCPSNASNDPTDDHAVFTIELHCVTFEVTARLTSTVNTIQYEIIDYKIKE